MYDELITQLEAVTEGSVELDIAILTAITPPAAGDPWVGAPRYTQSLERALTLVLEGMPVDIHIGPRGMGNDATVYQRVISTDEQGRRVTSYVKHEAMAVREGVIHWTPAPVQVCIAALKARAAVEMATNG